MEILDLFFFLRKLQREDCAIGLELRLRLRSVRRERECVCVCGEGDRERDERKKASMHEGGQSFHPVSSCLFLKNSF
jgi:hypothetical protein